MQDIQELILVRLHLQEAGTSKIENKSQISFHHCMCVKTNVYICSISEEKQHFMESVHCRLFQP